MRFVVCGRENGIKSQQKKRSDSSRKGISRKSRNRPTSQSTESSVALPVWEAEASQLQLAKKRKRERIRRGKGKVWTNLAVWRSHTMFVEIGLIYFTLLYLAIEVININLEEVVSFMAKIYTMTCINSIEY
jgi:hypothetical protein